jgi:hypothetical protein
MLTKICPKCNKPSYIDIPKDAYEKWQFGMLIQDAWPEGSDTERETLISGLCKDCQEGVFDDLQRETSIQED